MGGGMFGTASHVAESVQSAHKPSLVKRNSNATVTAIPILASEPFPLVDFGLIRADFDSIGPPWTGYFLPERLDLWTEGFGFGFDPEREKMISRYLKGHSVSRQRYTNWSQIDPSRKGLDDFDFGVYELSFMIPSGQSGSPLMLTDKTGNACLAGIVVGNSKASIGTVDKSEIVSESETLETIEYHNFLSLGLAISSESLLTLQSEVIGKMIIEHFGGKVAEPAL
jgi:hypothetical protein